jgi:hypothetical protein
MSLGLKRWLERVGTLWVLYTPFAPVEANSQSNVAPGCIADKRGKRAAVSGRVCWVCIAVLTRGYQLQYCNNSFVMLSVSLQH